MAKQIAAAAATVLLEEGMKEAISFFKGLDFTPDRAIGIKIYNGTTNTLHYEHSYFDSGSFEKNPPRKILPGESASCLVTNKSGGKFMRGVKGTFCYTMDNPKDKIVFYFNNPVDGRNKHYIQYYWDKHESTKWFYCNVGSQGAGHQCRHLINERLELMSDVSGGNHAAAAYVVKGHKDLKLR